jgi:hypothetical protein
MDLLKSYHSVFLPCRGSRGKKEEAVTSTASLYVSLWSIKRFYPHVVKDVI